MTSDYTDDNPTQAASNTASAERAVRALMAAYPDRFTTADPAKAWPDLGRGSLVDLAAELAHLAESLGQNPAQIAADGIGYYTAEVAREISEARTIPADTSACRTCGQLNAAAPRWFGPCKCSQPEDVPTDPTLKNIRRAGWAQAAMRVYAALVTPGTVFDAAAEAGAETLTDLHADLCHLAPGRTGPDLARHGIQAYEADAAEAAAQAAAVQAAQARRIADDLAAARAARPHRI